MIPAIRPDNPPRADVDSPDEVELVFRDIYRILRAHNRALVKIGGKPAKAEAKKNKASVAGLLLMLILLCCSVSQAGILWTWDMFNADQMERWMYDPGFRVALDLRNGAAIDNVPNGSITFTEGGETLELVFSTNNVELKSDTGILGVDVNDLYIVFNEISAPTGNPAANHGWLYVKDNGGTTTLYFEDADGTVTSCIGAGSGNTLDQAYDQGGAGSGKAVTVDSGAVALTATDAANNTVLSIVQQDTATASGIVITNAGTGISLDIDGQAGGTDIEGTGATWSVTGAGVATLASGSTTATWGVGTNLTVTGNTIANGNVDLGNAVTDTVSIIGSIDNDMYFDDGSGAPPQLIFRDGSDEDAAFNKTLTGALTLTTQSDDGLTIAVGNFRVGNGTPGTAPMDGEDAYFEGQVEFDSQTTFDAVAVHNEWIDLNEELDIDLDAADETVDITTSVTAYAADTAVLTVYASGAGATDNTYLLRLRQNAANDAQDHYLILENNNGDDLLAVNSGGATVWSLEAAGTVQINADTVANTSTTGVLNLDVQSATNTNIGFAIDYQLETGATQAYGIKMDLNDDSGGAEVFDYINLANSAGTNATSRGVVVANTVDDAIVATLGAGAQFAVVDAAATINTGTTGIWDVTAIMSEDTQAVMNILAESEADGAAEIVHGIWLQMNDDADNADNEIHGIHVEGDGTDGSGLQHALYVEGANIDAGLYLATGYLRVGTGSSPGQALGGADNAYIEGTLEVDGNVFFEGSGGITLANGVTIASPANERIEFKDTESIGFNLASAANQVGLTTDTGVDTIDVNDLDAIIGLQSFTFDNGQIIDSSVNNRIEITENSDTFGLIFGSNKVELANCNGTGVVEIDFNDVDTLSDIETLDSGTDAYMKWITNSLTQKRVVIPVCFISAAEIRAAPPAYPALCVGLAGVDELGSTEGYVEVSEGADYLRIGLQLPDDFIDAGNAGDLVIEFDIDEQAAEELNLEVKMYQYGDATPEVDDTITIANGTGRTWATFDTLSSGIGAVATLDAEDVFIVEITQEGADDNEDFYIYGIRLTYTAGIQNTQ